MKLFSTKALVAAALLLGGSFMYGAVNSLPAFAETVMNVKIDVKATSVNEMFDRGADSEIIAIGHGARNDKFKDNPGQQMLMAKRAAKVDAMRNLLETIQGVEIEANSTVENLMAEDDVIKAKVAGVVKGAVVVSEEEDELGTFKVVLRMPVYGSNSFASALIDEYRNRAPEPAPAPLLPSVQAENEAPMSAEQILADARKQAEAIISNAKAQADAIIAEAKAKVSPAPEQGAPTVVATAPAPVAKVTVLDKASIQNLQTSGYTGVVVDASGLGLVSTFSPIIYDQEGRPVYGMKNVDPQYAIKMGMVEYSSNLEQSKLQSRAGSNPLVLKAKAVSGGKNSINKVNVVVSVADGDKILLANEKSGMLKQCAVVFVK